MFDDARREISEMIARGLEPAAIIMTPKNQTRFLAEPDPSRSLHRDDRGRGSGWAFEGLPIYRSWEISGPCVVTADVLRVLLKAGRHRRSLDLHESLTEPAVYVENDLDPILF